ncbi:MAG TPA: tetratricopeptide repeat protein [Thermoanaerobaculia bacterium]|nr:tetratricopeptide repeat protein [Thermoanaerobaculia bacterium]
MRAKWLLLLVLGAGAAPVFAAADPAIAVREAFLAAKMSEADGKFEQAVGEFRKALALSPDDPVIHFELAALLQQMGVDDEARQEAMKAAGLDATFESAWRLAGAIDLGGAEKDPSHVPAAVAELEKAHHLSPQNPGTAAALARAELLAGRPDLARAVLDDVPGLADNPNAIKVRAEADDKRGADAEARQDYDRWLASDPTDHDALASSIEFRESRRDFDGAVELLRKLRSAEPDNAPVADRIALDLLRGGKFAEAEKEARALTAARPEDRAARRTLAAALDMQGHSEESAAILRKLIEEDPDDPTAAVTLAYQLSGSGRGDEAIALLQKFVDRLGTPPSKPALAREVRSEIAGLLYRDRRFDVAKKVAAESAIGKEGVGERALGVILERARDENHPAEGLSWAKKAAEVEPSNPDWKGAVAEFEIRGGARAEGEKSLSELARSGIAGEVLAAADARERLKDWNASAAIAEDGMKRFAGNVDLMFRRGSALERMGKIDDAAAVFGEILKIRPDDANTLNYLGYMYADKGIRLADARRMLERAVALDPQNGAYLDSLGWVCFRMNDLRQAEEFLSKAAQKIPTDATVQEHLGDLDARRGQMAEAVVHWKRSLTLSPEEPEKIEKKIHDSGARR